MNTYLGKTFILIQSMSGLCFFKAKNKEIWILLLNFAYYDRYKSSEQENNEVIELSQMEQDANFIKENISIIKPINGRIR